MSSQWPCVLPPGPDLYPKLTSLSFIKVIIDSRRMSYQLKGEQRTDGQLKEQGDVPGMRIGWALHNTRVGFEYHRHNYLASPALRSSAKSEQNKC